jgi:hypothetical protein
LIQQRFVPIGGEEPTEGRTVDHCIRHFEEPVVASCRTCEKPFCGRCLVFAYGPNKPPYCIGCALTASGVRNTRKIPIPAPKPPKVDRRVERDQRKAARAEAKEARRAAKAGPLEADEVRTDTVPVPDRLETPASRYSVLTAPEPPTG